MSQSVKVWDIAVRVFHWSLVTAFAAAWLTGEDDSQLHQYIGYFIAALVIFRVVWGIAGSHYARFRSFLFSSAETLTYLRETFADHPRQYLGHNPLGALMVFALLLSLSGTVISGLMLNGDLAAPAMLSATAPQQGAELVKTEYRDDDDDHEAAARDHEQEEGEQHEMLEEWHEFFANLTVLLIALHVVGVVVASRQHKENLVKAMLTGMKTRND